MTCIVPGTEAYTLDGVSRELLMRREYGPAHLLDMLSVHVTEPSSHSPEFMLSKSARPLHSWIYSHKMNETSCKLFRKQVHLDYEHKQ